VKISTWKPIGWLFTLLLLAFCVWIYSRIEFVDKTITGSFQGAAARNPLLAIGRLAERYGATAHYTPAYTKPPRSGATLVFAAPRHWLSTEQNTALLNWVAMQGGHLIISPHHQQRHNKRAGRNSDRMTHDPLLAALKISARYLPVSDDKEQTSEAWESSVKLDPDETPQTLFELLQQIGKPSLEIQTIKLPDGMHLKARFDPRLRLQAPEGNSDWRISEAPSDTGNPEHRGDYGLGTVWGKGRITVLANLDFINNSTVADADHAALFVYLSSLAKGQDIWFVYGTDVPALWRWLIDYAWTVLIAVALLLIIWLWMISRRFGPMLPARSAERRSIVEHVTASAHYLWRCKQGQALYRLLCNDFHKRACLRHPHWSQLPAQELYRQILLFAHETQVPQLSGLTEHAVEHLFDTSRPRGESQFAADSHLLDILRNRL